MQETERAKAENRVEPDWSNTVEMLLRKGVSALDTLKKKSYLNPR
ncbi:MAG: hypothetical protein ACM3WQ_03375 [Chloroflexota bacterium]